MHLLDWPKSGKVDERLLANMEQTRFFVNAGLAARATAKYKVRQPLGETVVETSENVDLPSEFVETIQEELNVKGLLFEKVERGTNVKFPPLTPELKREGLMRELIRQIQSARKTAGFNVDDRIVLTVHTDDPELQEAIREHRDTITAETLANTLVTTDSAAVEGSYQANLQIEGVVVALVLVKA